jgi:TOM7 family
MPAAKDNKPWYSISKVMPIAKVIVQYGWVPAVILAGRHYTDPKPSLGDILNPFW